MGTLKENIEPIINATEESLELIYKDVAHPALSILGETLGTVMECACLFAVPIKFWNQKVKANFQYRLEQYVGKLMEVPKEQREEVHTQIGVPVVQRLSYTTCDEIADMFTNLLLTASNRETMSDAHPAFISMIDRLSPDEAKMVQCIGESYFVLYCEANYICKKEKKENLEEFDFGTSFATIRRWATNIPYQVELTFPENCNLYLANLISLEILIDKHGFNKIGFDNQYEEIALNNKLKELEDEMDKEKYEKLEINRSYFEVTDLGRRFIRACCNI